MYKKQELKNTQRSRILNSFLRTFQKRVLANPPGVCCISTHIAYLRTARSQTCGKCVPCAKGLEQLERMMQKILDGGAELTVPSAMKLPIWCFQISRISRMSISTI